MRKDYTILIPEMSPIHFQFLEAAIGSAGYKVKRLPTVDKNAVDEGLKYINNDACYPTIVTLGQIISYLKSGEVDLDKVGVFMSQTGGGCRASNYVALLRKALKDLNMEQIPVIFGKHGRTRIESRLQDLDEIRKARADGAGIRRSVHARALCDEAV